jgi:hypothetical protein
VEGRGGDIIGRGNLLARGEESLPEGGLLEAFYLARRLTLFAGLLGVVVRVSVVDRDGMLMGLSGGSLAGPSG